MSLAPAYVHESFSSDSSRDYAALAWDLELDPDFARSARPGMLAPVAGAWHRPTRARSATPMSGTTLGLTSAVLTLALGAEWYRRAMAVRVPDDKRGFLMGMALACALGVGALAVGPGLAGGAGAVLGVLGGGTFLLLSVFSRQARPVPAVAVGSPLLPVQATTDTGAPFDVSSLAGTPMLLKFFRGHW